jgi:AIPR protein
MQSKFRSTEKNFETKEIEIGELLVMDIDRITGGKAENAKGETYNGKIQGLIRRISEIPDIARYNYHVVILANWSLPLEQLRKLTEGHSATVFNFERSYSDLVFPIVSGTYHRAQDVTIRLDLNNKSAGAKTSYSVETPEYQCEITVLFVPTLEIAKAMDKYRNTILEYNPRSYLELEGQQVNSAIRETLTRPDSNAFALMNNGITILSDETSLNERIGQENKAQLHLLRPQIINGGQTAYTLSRIYNEDKEGAEGRFAGKEVLTKIITLTPKDPKKDTSVERMSLINEISAASNRQTPVINADRVSNDSMYTKLQLALFDRFGVLFERKRGEFNDGVVADYISRSQIVERNLFLRIFFAALGKLDTARRKRIFLHHSLRLEQLTDPSSLDAFADAYYLFRSLTQRREINQNPNRYRDVLAKVYIGVMRTDKTAPIELRANQIETLWDNLLMQVAQNRAKYAQSSREVGTGKKRGVFSVDRWMTSSEFEQDIHDFVKYDTIKPRKNVTNDAGSAEFNAPQEESFAEGAKIPEDR